MLFGSLAGARWIRITHYNFQVTWYYPSPRQISTTWKPLHSTTEGHRTYKDCRISERLEITTYFNVIERLHTIQGVTKNCRKLFAFFTLGFEFYHTCCICIKSLGCRNSMKQLCFLYADCSRFLAPLNVILYYLKLFSEVLCWFAEILFYFEFYSLLKMLHGCCKPFRFCVLT